MGSSEGWLLLASQEAVRVEEQARNIWSALQKGMGEAHAPAYQVALENANEAFGEIVSTTKPAERLAHATSLLKQAKEHHARLVNPLNTLE